MGTHSLISRMDGLRAILLAGILFGMSVEGWARPVSYPGGWMAMEMHDVASTAAEITYSPSAFYSVGYRGEYHPSEDWQFHGVALNNLLKRWNRKHSQANLFLMSGAGVAVSDRDAWRHHTEAAAYTGIEADWETRRWFTLYSNRITYAGDIEKEFSQTARLGIAPYIGDYGDLHTWLMVQFDHRPGSSDPSSVTPMVRMFKGNFLWEAGISNHGDLLFNFTTQF